MQLSASDFDAYAPEKATSNAYSRPRLEVKQRALGWARRVMARLNELGIHVDVHGSDEHPTLRNKKRVDCQWVFFWRDAAAREELDRLLDASRTISEAIDDPSPYRRHAFLALRIDSAGIEVCFAVHPEAVVDVDNLRARLSSKEGAPSGTPTELAAELTAALVALPEEFAVGVGTERIAAARATPEVIEAMLERAAEGQVPLWIGWSVPRDVALDHAETIGEQLEDAIIALTPIYELVAWSRKNDHIALDRRLEGMERERAKTHAEMTAQNEKWRADQEAQREKALAEARARGESEGGRAAPSALGGRPLGGPMARKPSLDSLFKPSPKGDAERDARKGKPSEHKPLEQKTPAPPEARPRGASATKGAHAGSPSAASSAPPVMEKGARVGVLRGPFAGKVGIVAELDGRGGARVLLGLLSTRIEVTNLEVVQDGRERPSMQSSHRPPVSPKGR